MVAAIASFCLAEDRPQITCKGTGREFVCTAPGTQDYTYLPKWIYHTKPIFESYGEEFRSKASKNWTILEMNIYPNDQSQAPYDGALYYHTEVWVGVCKGYTVFTYVIKEIKPECPKE